MEPTYIDLTNEDIEKFRREELERATRIGTGRASQAKRVISDETAIQNKVRESVREYVNGEIVVFRNKLGWEENSLTVRIKDYFGHHGNIKFKEAYLEREGGSLEPIYP